MFTARLTEAMDPFVKELREHNLHKNLCNGTLPKPIFQQFLLQDRWYLCAFAKILERIAKIVSKSNHQDLFNNLSEYIVAAELEMQKDYLGFNKPNTFYQPKDLKEIKLLSSILIYIQHLNKLVEEAEKVAEAEKVEKAAMAAAGVFPCFGLYCAIGDSLNQNDLEDENIYGNWLKCYKDETFITSTNTLRETIVEISVDLNLETQNKVIAVIEKSCEAEKAFWNEIWSLTETPEEAPILCISSFF